MTEDILDKASADRCKELIEESFADLDDYRRQKSVKYLLSDILFITICATISGADDLKSVAVYAKHKEGWLQEILSLPDGVPSYSTFWTVFMLLKPEPLGKCFVGWVQRIIKPHAGDRIISIDGKALRGTKKKGDVNSFVHMVSAWAQDQHLTLGQLKVNCKSNEITAIPVLLDAIDIKGSTVTIDAMGCQKEIAAKIVDRGGEYILALKGNQGKLSDEVENYFNQAEAVDFDGVEHDVISTEDKGHGRQEKRTVYATEDIDWLPQLNDWENLKSIVMVVSERTTSDGATSIERRYYISTLPANAARAADTIRKHWGIEHTHWILDVAFREDEQNANAGHIAENMSLIRRIALNLIKQDKTTKCGVENRRKLAGWDNQYLLSLLSINFFS